MLIRAGAAKEGLAFPFAAGVGAPESPRVSAVDGLCVRAWIWKNCAGIGELRCELLPFTGGGIRFAKFTCRPIAGAGCSEKRLVNVDLARASDDVSCTLGHNGGGFVVVNLVQEAATGVNISPEVEGESATDLTHSGNEGLGIDAFRDAVAPPNVVQGA